MRKKLATLSCLIPSALCLLLLVKLDYSLMRAWLAEERIDERLKLVVLFINLILAFVSFSPLLSKFLNKMPNHSLESFLGLEQPPRIFRYIDIYDYLSGLALSAFYLSVLIYTMKGVFESTGWFIGGFYVFLMFVASITIGGVALMKFIWIFTRSNHFVYLVSSLLASSICIAVLGVAMRMIS